MRRTLSTSLVCDVGKDAAKVLPGIRPLHPGMAMQGSAMTLRVPPGDDRGVHLALDSVEAGCVLVIDAGGDGNRAVVGSAIVHRARYLRLAGLVVWGAVRDTDEIVRMNFPTFAAATCPVGPTQSGEAVVNRIVLMSGLAVGPGDAIVADSDGVVVIAHDAWPRVASAVQGEMARLQHVITAIDDGEKTADIYGLRNGPKDA